MADRETRTPRTEESIATAKALFIAAFRNAGVVSHACESACIGRTTAYKYRDEDEQFRKAWDDAEQLFIDDLEHEAFRRGKEKSDVLLMFALRNNRTKYQERASELEALLAIMRDEIQSLRERIAPPPVAEPRPSGE